MDQLFALTQIKKRILTEDYRYEYVYIWEHEWQRQILDDPAISQYVSTLDIQERLDPRESFFGGRTNAAKLHYRAGEEEKIKYVDFTR